MSNLFKIAYLKYTNNTILIRILISNIEVGSFWRCITNVKKNAKVFLPSNIENCVDELSIVLLYAENSL